MAHLFEADVLIVENAGGITAAYPISEKGRVDLDTLGLRSHRQPEYNTSFYPIPMILENAKAHLEKKFEVEYVSC
jgi:hypothetical protein